MVSFWNHTIGAYHFGIIHVDQLDLDDMLDVILVAPFFLLSSNGKFKMINIEAGWTIALHLHI